MARAQRLAAILLIALAQAFLACGSVLADTPPPDIPHVLLLYPYDNFHAASMETGAAARQRLIDLSGTRIDFYVEFLDFLRFPVETDADRVSRELAEKYRNTRIDIILAFNSESYRFVLNHAADFAPHAHSVFCCVTDEHLTTYGTRKDFPGIKIDYNLRKTFDLMRALQPDLSEVVMFGGAGQIDRTWTSIFRSQLDTYATGVKLIYLEGLTRDAMLARAASMPPHSAILMGVVFIDGDGRRRAGYEYAEEVAAAANVPTYGAVATYFGRGIVGGHIGTFTDAGQEMAEIAWKILQGADPTLIGTRPSTAQNFRVDARAMERFGLSPKRLPPGTIIDYARPNIWQQYRGLVIAALAVIALQTGMILALIAQRRQRRTAEHEARLAHANLARVTRMTTMGEMTASIAHEVNQPLAAIVANSSAALRWLQRATPDTAEVKAALERIADEGLRAANVIAAVRAMFGGRSTEKDAVDPAGIVRSVLDLTSGEFAAEGVALRTQFAPDLPAIRGDPVQLQQVVLNLVTNAVDAMRNVPAHSRILTVTLTGSGDTVALRVRDTGPGIPPESRDRIFEAFYSTKANGMGMGLAICRSIVAAHGGTLEIEQSDDRGTCFRVTLPASRLSLPVTADAP